MMKWKNCKLRKRWWMPVGLMVAAVFAGVAFSFSKTYENTFSIEEIRPYVVLVDDIESFIPFAIDSLCQITDSSRSLDAFLSELEMLLAGKDTVIQIVHLGDSHVQAGFYTGQVMRLLHSTFGNAGRGWIAPLKLAKINEPKDYYITSSTVKDWIAGRCIQLAPKCMWGIGGMGIQTVSKTIDFEVSVTPTNGAGYEFNRVLFYRDDLSMPLRPVNQDSVNIQTAWGTDTGLPHLVVDTFSIDNETNTIRLQSIPRLDMPSGHDPSILQTPNCYYGFSLINSHPGILYHAIGQNSAMYKHFTDSSYFRQLALLRPSLLIVTLGTNETVGIAHLSDGEFTLQLDRFIRLAKEYLPATAILLTTPAENFKRVSKKYVRNENIALIAREIEIYAQREGLACFDLYGMTGGAGSCNQWQQAGLMGRDRVHYSIEGYYEQGKLLYKALVRLKNNNN